MVIAARGATRPAHDAMADPDAAGEVTSGRRPSSPYCIHGRKLSVRCRLLIGSANGLAMESDQENKYRGLFVARTFWEIIQDASD
jgi:hypothetical protein